MIPIHTIAKHASIFLVFLVGLNYSYSQNRALENEYVIISTDRSVYLAGEQIYFTAFYDNYISDNPKNISNILYVEVYNKREALIQTKFKIKDNIIRGKLDLPDDLYSGNYFIRAYTKYQRNKPAVRMHNLLLAIINPNDAFPKEDISNRPLVESLRIDTDSSEYLLRLNDSGQKIDHLILLNDSGQVLKILPTNANRLLSFTRSKNDTVTHTVRCINTKGDTVTNMALKDFPLANVSMKLQKGKNKATLYINIRKEIIAQYGSDMKLTVKNSGYETIGDRLFNAGQDDHIEFKPELFSDSGLYYFILENFNSEVIHVSARFIAKPIASQELFTLSQQTVSPRSSVKVKFSNQLPVAYSEFSVTASGLQYELCESLPYHLSFSHTLLRSWLHTRPIDDKNIVNQINAALHWQETELKSELFLNNLYFNSSGSTNYIPDIHDVSVSGKAFNTETGETAGDIDVFASVVYGENQMHHVRTDKSGNFIFSLNNIEGKQNIFITTRPDEGDISLNVLSDFHEEKPVPADIPLLVDTTDTDLFRQLYLNKQLNHLFPSPELKPDSNVTFTTVNFDGLQNYRTILDEYIQMPTMEDVFHELVPYVKAVKTNNEYRIVIYNEELKKYYENPLVLLDYMPVFNINQLMKIDPTKIDVIDVINQTFVSGNYLFDGLILISSKTKDFAGMEISDKSVYLKYAGIQEQMYPVFPRYNEPSELASSEPDFRHLLHYQAFSQKLPESHLFYTSDQKGEYELIITGFTKDGRVFKTRKTINVE